MEVVLSETYMVMYIFLYNTFVDEWVVVMVIETLGWTKLTAQDLKCDR